MLKVGEYRRYAVELRTVKSLKFRQSTLTLSGSEQEKVSELY